MKTALNSPFVIIGIGKSGLAAKNLLLATGHDTTTIFTFDEKNPTAQFTQWNELDKLPRGTLIVSPGVSLQSPGLVSLRKKGWAITSEINLACAYLTDEIIIGITGSVGKSTVTSLLGVAAQFDDPHAFVGGNLGTPFCQYALDLVVKKTKARYIVIELSSYQLENCSSLHLDYSAITFLSSNHLERYPNAEAYYLTKCAIGKMTKHVCVLNASSADILRYQNYISGSKLLINYKTSTEKPFLEKSALIGEHNLDNLALAYELAQLLKLSSAAQQSMLQFKGLNHRLETVGVFNQNLFINDSKATAMDSVLVAMHAALSKVEPGGKLYLLLGGKDKNLPWEDLKVLASEKNIEFLFFGQCALIAQAKSGLPGLIFEKLEKALATLLPRMTSKNVILLSPGGTSLDEFNNFEERGNFFKKTIHDFYSIK